MNSLQLYEIARTTLKPIKLKQFGSAGHVACALETKNGNIFTGICIDIPCALGFCAEQAAIAEMLKTGETQIKKIIAVYENGDVLPPCGKCREFITQLDEYNYNTIVIVAQNNEIVLQQLLPERWDKRWE